MKFTTVLTLTFGLLLGSTAFGSAYCPLKDGSSIHKKPGSEQLKVASLLGKLGKRTAQEDTSSATKGIRN